ncbi:MAG: U32 family peptidase [Candidatus Gastranaerophilaceae bacterium]|jgi:collagenase-like PrtC family protease
MKKPNVLFPAFSPDDIDICSKVNSRNIYIYYDYFLKNGFETLLEFIEKAKQYDARLFINFKNTITDKEILFIKVFLDFIEKTDITGIMINNFFMLDFISSKPLPFKVFVDSGMDIHNLSGVEFIRSFQKIDNLNISEEIYVKNIARIKKYTNLSLSVDSDNLPWIVDELLKSKSVDFVVIKGDFLNNKELLDGVTFIEKIIENPTKYQNKKLPFKTLHDYTYEVNPFTKEFLSTKGKNFKFRGNIEKFKWQYKETRLKKDFDKNKIELPKLSLRLNSLDQIKALKKCIKSFGFNPVYGIEYGEILNTSDLAKSSFNQILDKVKDFCAEHHIKLQLSTPRILTERDFDRVYDYVKQLFDNNPPDSIVVNNIGFWWAVINDSDYSDIPIELGQGLNILSGASINCLINQHKVESVELSSFIDINDAELCIKNIINSVPYRKLTVGGSIRIPCSGLCPLNNDSAVLSRLSCSAPCHKGNYSVVDKDREKIYTFTVDGFCRMHMFRDKILDLFKYIKPLQSIGINEFVLDFSCLETKLVPILLTRFLNSLSDKNYKTDENFLDKLYYLNYHY